MILLNRLSRSGGDAARLAACDTRRREAIAYEHTGGRCPGF